MGRLILFEAGPGVKVLNLSQRRCGGSNRGPPYQVQPLAPLNQHSVGGFSVYLDRTDSLLLVNNVLNGLVDVPWSIMNSVRVIKTAVMQF